MTHNQIQDAIGGYFSLELPIREEYHKDSIKLNTGRNCLEYILRCRKYKKIYIPYYICEVILEPLHKLGIDYIYYNINFDFEIIDDIHLKPHEALLYTNYYGLKQRYIETLTIKYGEQLIIDNAQAFYAKPIKGIDTFYSCRKFFGVPDGAYLYTDVKLTMELEQDISYNRMNHLVKRIDLSAEEGFTDFLNVDEKLNYQSIKHMSKLTERIMQSIDYDNVAKCRRNNFNYLHSQLSHSNILKLHLDTDTVPMVYPYMNQKEDLKMCLIKNRVYVATYWHNILELDNGHNKISEMVKNLTPLPCDQRYGINNMDSILNIINMLLETK